MENFLCFLGGVPINFLGEITSRIFLFIGGHQPNSLLDDDPVEGLSCSNAIVVFAFVWSYGDLGIVMLNDDDEDDDGNSDDDDDNNDDDS